MLHITFQAFEASGLKKKIFEDFLTYFYGSNLRLPGKGPF